MTVGGENISSLSRLSVSGALSFLDSLEPSLTDRERKIGERILKEIRERLGFLQSVGLEYLSLSRASGTLSGARASASASPPRSDPT